MINLLCNFCVSTIIGHAVLETKCNVGTHEDLEKAMRKYLIIPGQLLSAECTDPKLKPEVEWSNKGGLGK